MRKFITAVVLLTGIASALAQPTYGTAAQARAMLERAIVALKADPKAAIAHFNQAGGGFRDRDLYVVCFDAETGRIQAHVDPARLGEDIRLNKQADGKPFGQAIFDAAKEGRIATVDYLFAKPGSTTPTAKQSFVTRVGGTGCLVGYYK
jgi:hypothetical protein